MLFDTDRLAVLSGLPESRSGMLNEAKHKEAGMNELQNLRAQEDADAGSDRDDLQPEERPELEEGLESRLREMIRDEIMAALQEAQATRDEQTITSARQTKSVGVAMGFGGFGFEPRKAKNRSVARGSGGSVGFGGPGFM